MPVPAGTQSASIGGGDPSGKYLLGNSTDTSGQTHTLLWTGGAVQDLGVSDQHLMDIDSSGEIVGDTPADGDGGQVYVRAYGQTITLSAPGSPLDTEAVGISNDGEVAGTAFYQDNERDGYAVAWSPGGSVDKLPRPSGFNTAQATGIDADGTVVGTVTDMDWPDAETLNEKAIAWFPDGTWKLLPGLDSDSFTEGVAISNGTVIGNVADGDPLEWDASSGTPSALPADGRPVAINSGGSVVLEGSGSPVWVHDGVSRTLPDFDPVMGTGNVGLLTDSDVAYGSDVKDITYETVPVRWDCADQT
jgi:uncharacterized membrane protein